MGQWRKGNGADKTAPVLAAGWWVAGQRPPLDDLVRWPEAQLPEFVRQCPVAMDYLRLLGQLNWQHFPEPPLRQWDTRQAEARAHFVAAFLVKVVEEKPSMPALRKFLVKHPALVWVLGFRLLPDARFSWGFDAEASLPTHRHFSRVLRELPNACLQFLLQSSVQLLQDALPAEVNFGDEISLDTKHIIGWVKENNPKCYVPDRYDKTQQPKGDPDCKLGCKKKSNERKGASAGAAESGATPTSEGLPASRSLPALEKGEYYWGYASGVVATKIDAWGEFVLAELTQTFDKADQSYFQPLMAQTEANLGQAPRFGTLDKAFDWFVVYEYFDQAGGFAAVPYADRADHHKTFDEHDLPLCEAGLPMPLISTVNKKKGCLVPHELGRHRCPLLFPTPTGETCPIQHKNWLRTSKDQGCITALPTSVGNRVRHQLDRTSAEYKRIYKQRTAVERINSRALELGIERPKLRSYTAVANHNTLLYVVLNLQALERVKQRRLNC
jgi:hypothetical protein